MRTSRRPLTVVPVTSHSPERDAELLSRLDDDDADARDRRIMVGPTFDELTAERARPRALASEYVTVPALCPHPDSQFDNRAVVPAFPAAAFEEGL